MDMIHEGYPSKEDILAVCKLKKPFELVSGYLGCCGSMLSITKELKGFDTFNLTFQIEIQQLDGEIEGGFDVHVWLGEEVISRTSDYLEVKRESLSDRDYSLKLLSNAMERLPEFLARHTNKVLNDLMES